MNRRQLCAVALVVTVGLAGCSTVTTAVLGCTKDLPDYSDGDLGERVEVQGSVGTLAGDGSFLILNEDQGNESLSVSIREGAESQVRNSVSSGDCITVEGVVVNGALDKYAIEDAALA